jgi:uncharacterized protein YndB with AHSA1/START domain
MTRDETASLAERAIRAQIDVPGSAEDVWAAWTTEEGARSFFAPACRIEARPNGAYELYFDLEAPPGERGGEGMRLLALDPPRLLSFTWNAPPHLSTVRGQRTFVQVVLESLADDTTRVHLLHTGFSRGGEWDDVYAYFERAWPDIVLRRLAHRFEHGPYDWESRPAV